MEFRGPERVRYPWQGRVVLWAKTAKMTPAERRMAHADFTYSFEHHLVDEPAYDSPLARTGQGASAHRSE